jgi:hypothetical protein
VIFRHIVTLYPLTMSESSLGGIQKAYAATGANFAAFVQHRTESRDIINDTAGARSMTVIYVQGNCPAKPLDRMTFDGKTYEVTGAVYARSPQLIHHTKIMTVELDQTGL